MSRLVPSVRKNGSLVPFGNLFDNFLGFAPLYDYETFKVDVREEILHYLVEAELPGVDKKDVKIDFHNGRLNIYVNHEDNIEEEDINYIHKERRSSSTGRSLYLEGATGEGITAALENGLLRIEVPKKGGGSHKKRIEIK